MFEKVNSNRGVPIPNKLNLNEIVKFKLIDYYFSRTSNNFSGNLL